MSTDTAGPCFKKCRRTCYNFLDIHSTQFPRANKKKSAANWTGGTKLPPPPSAISKNLSLTLGVGHKTYHSGVLNQMTPIFQYFVA